MTSLSTSTTTTTTTTTTTHPHPSLQKIINLHQVIQTSSSFEKLQDQHVTPHWVALDELSLFLEDLRKEKVNFMKEKKALVNYLLNLQNSIQQLSQLQTTLETQRENLQSNLTTQLKTYQPMLEDLQHQRQLHGLPPLITHELDKKIQSQTKYVTSRLHQAMKLQLQQQQQMEVEAEEENRNKHKHKKQKLNDTKNKLKMKTRNTS
ncbi:hypothetical protein HMI54_014655 [Coelomomyces lativittatus]|nr:hypothetical protein HMI55_000049 [Coelomomyces lativittatus]KAJ1513835.1 hypothetical protein HMI54_014655 [Coelomomyces lativittatus]